MLDSKEFKIYWAEARKTREALEVKFETIPDIPKMAADPRAMDGDKWREKSRPTIMPIFGTVRVIQRE